MTSPPKAVPHTEGPADGPKLHGGGGTPHGADAPLPRPHDGGGRPHGACAPFPRAPAGRPRAPRRAAPSWGPGQ